MKENGKAQLIHVAVCVSDPDQVIKYYEKALGLEFKARR